jgi:integrase/recombinase XerD
MDIDIHDYSGKLVWIKEHIKKSDISQKNKELLLDFGEDCLTGWKVPRVSKARTLTLLQRLRILTIEIRKEWPLFDERDTKRMLLWMDNRYPLPDGAWSQHSYRIVLRKFVTWLRRKHGYPEGYPAREKLVDLLRVAKYAEEVSHIHIKEPDRLRDSQTIPTDKEMGWLCEAATHPRDKAYIEMSREHGERIGGLGTRQIKHIKFDSTGALVTMHDKTFRGEPVRYITSAMYLRQWLEVHPFKNDPEAPLWVNLQILPECKALDYPGFRMIIKRLTDRHNRLAEKNGEQKIAKNISTHLFRYYAQTRDEKNKMPRTIMCKLRGWKPDSKQPERYARLTSEDVDDYLKQMHGIEDKKEELQKLIKCPRCKEINASKSTYCYKCGMPMSRDAEDTEAKLREIVNRILKEGEVTDQMAMELVVDTRRLYKEDLEAFEQAAEVIKNQVGIPVVSQAVEKALQIAKGERGFDKLK